MSGVFLVMRALENAGLQELWGAAPRPEHGRDLVFISCLGLSPGSGTHSPRVVLLCWLGVMVVCGPFLVVPGLAVGVENGLSFLGSRLEVFENHPSWLTFYRCLPLSAQPQRSKGPFLVQWFG